MELRHLRYFIAVAEEEHFHRAANRLNIAQPAVSRQIRALEEEIGAELFNRMPRGVTLSDAGRIFLSDARKIVQDVDNAKDRAFRVSRGQAGHLRIAFNEVAARQRIVPRFLQRFRASHAGVDLKLSMKISQDQVPALLDDEIDAGFMFFRPDLPELAHITIYREKFILAVPEDHRLAKRGSVKLAELTDEALIWPSQALNKIYYAQLRQACLDRGLMPNIVQESNYEHQILSLVSAEMGLGFLLSSIQHRHEDGIVFLTIEDLDISTTLDLVWLKENRSRSLEEFVGVVAQNTPLEG